MIRTSVLYPAAEGAVFDHDSKEATTTAMSAEGSKDLAADVPNDTTISPLRQVSEIV
jgi:hypothetical protein